MTDACERLRRLLLVWQMSVPAILLLPRGMLGVLPCSPGTVNASAHNTVDASEARAGALPYLSGMGVDGAHNTVTKNVDAYNTAWVLSCKGGRRVLSCRCIGYGLRYYG